MPSGMSSHPLSPAKPWWESRSYALLLVMLSTLPLLWPDIPPLVDLPGHMGRFTVETELHSSASLSRYYGFEWAVMGNLGLDVLIVPLAKIFGVELGTKLLVIAIPVLTTSGLLLTARQIHHYLPATAAFALPLAYGYPFQFGFVNFALSMALAFNAFALWIWLGEKRRFALRSALFIPISLMIWLSHVYGWGVLGLLCYSNEFYRNFRDGRGFIPSLFLGGIYCLPLIPPLLPMLIWQGSSDNVGVTRVFFNWEQKFDWIIDALRDRWRVFDIASVVLLFLVILIAFWPRRMQHSPRLALGAVLMIATFILMPRILIGSNYADMRMAPFIFAVILIGIRVTDIRWQKYFAVAALAFFLVRIGANTVSFWLYDKEFDRQLVALDHVAEGSRVVALIGNDCRDLRAPERTYHLPGLAIVRRHAFVNEQWALAGSQLIQIKYRGAAPFISDPSQIVTTRKCGEWFTTEEALARLPHGRFDYLWMINVETARWPNDPRLQKLWESGSSVLYKAAP